MTHDDRAALLDRFRERAEQMRAAALERDPDVPLLDPLVREPPDHFPDEFPESVAEQRDRWSALASVVVVDSRVDEPRVLAVERGFAPGWQVPGGDHEDDETLAETALRETREETNVEAEITGVLYAREMHLDYGTPDPVPIPMVVFTGRRVAGRRAVPHNYLPTGEPEIVEAEWFRAEELPSNLRDRERIREYLDSVA